MPIPAVVCVTDQFLMELQIEVSKIYKNFRFNLSPHMVRTLNFNPSSLKKTRVQSRPDAMASCVFCTTWLLNTLVTVLHCVLRKLTFF